MIETDSIRRKLLLHTLASSAAVYVAFLRMVTGYLSPREHWTYMVLALMVGGIQAALLIGRCATVDWWVRRGSPVKSKRRTLLSCQAGLVTEAVLVAVVGGVLVYDGYWMLEPDLPNPALDLLWLLGYVLSGLLVFVYLGLFYRQIGQVYDDLPRRRQAAALVIGLLPEMGFYGLCSALFLWYAITIASQLA